MKDTATALLVTFAWTALAAPGVAATISAPLDDTRVVSDETTMGALGTVTPNTSADYPVRSRGTESQDDAQVASFLQFDVSSLSVADVNNPAFNATFRIDYTFQLNTVNDMAVFVGRNQSGAWDSSGSNNPLHDWGWDDQDPDGPGFVAAADGELLVANVRTTAPPVNDITADVSDIVKGWVDGTNPNQGFVLYYENNVFQGAGFDNAELLLTVPEPSAFALSAFGLLAVGIVVWRRGRTAFTTGGGGAPL